jgi:hypothetical protein
MKNSNNWGYKMCIVIDANTFAPVFDTRNQRHDEFKPVHDWIFVGKGKIVYGGTKYKEELRRAARYLKIFIELQKARKVVEVNDQDVDAKQAELEELITHKDFDDPHLIAIVIVSGVKLICSDDARAYPFIKDNTLYPRNIDRPRIYSRSSNQDLLTDANIADICKPASKPPKGLRDMIAE